MAWRILAAIAGLLTAAVAGAADPITVTVRFRLPDGFDESVDVTFDTVTVYDRVNLVSCTTGGQLGEPHLFTVPNALTAFHEAMLLYGMPYGMCDTAYELRFDSPSGLLHLRGVNCVREGCQIDRWVCRVNGAVIPVEMQEWQVADGDSILVESVPLTGIRDQRILPSSPRVGVVPNPVTHLATVRVETFADARLTVAVYDVTGSRVKTLQPPHDIAPGIRGWVWDASDGDGFSVPSGVYFIRVADESRQTGDHPAWQRTIKVVVQRE